MLRHFLAVYCVAPAVPCVTVFLCVTGVPAADGVTTVDLSPRRRPGQISRVTTAYEVAGSLTLADQDKPTQVPLAVSATATYDQRLLGVEPAEDVDGNSSPGALRRSVRYYEQQDVKLLINGKEVLPQLRNNRRLIGASFSEGRLTIFSPQGPLTREELDLVQWPGDSLVADALLPASSVAVGGSWQVDEAMLGALLNIDTVGQSDVSAELIETNRDYAQIDAEGVVHGTVDGTTTTIEIKSRCYFDLHRRSVHSLQLVTKEKRSAGEVSPGVEAVAKVRLQFVPLSRSDSLSDSVVAKMGAVPGADAIQLSFLPTNRVYHLLHDRYWHVTSDAKSAVVLRRMQDGDVLGQCNISALPVIEKGKQVTLESFRDDVRSTLGKNFGRFVKAGEFVDQRGRLVYHVEAEGKVTDVPIHWRYYLVGEPDGRRAALVFTLEQSMAVRFGQADRQILSGFDFLASDTAAKPQPPSADQVRERAIEKLLPRPPQPPLAPTAGLPDDQEVAVPQRVGRGDEGFRPRR
jgi:hypothetical protein